MVAKSKLAFLAFSWSMAMAAWSGCFKHPDDKVSEMVCTTDENCPVGYQCMLGRCLTPGSIGTPDASSGIQGDADGVRADGPTADAPLGPLDGPPTDAGGRGELKTGASCALSSECESGNCVDGICCESPCQGTCSSCAQLYTGKLDGTCAPVGAGKQDPQSRCADETTKNQCGSDGSCDGAGACRKVGTDHVCTTASCSGSSFTPTSTCDGKGACKAVVATNCGSAGCDVVDGCRSPCTTSKDCPDTAYCNPSTQRCAATKIDGDSCTAASECSSGFCVDGVCCNQACSGACMACSSAFTTQKSGVCSPVKVGTDPHESCTADPSNACGTDGTCDGVGACRMAGAERVCKPAACSSEAFTHAATCDGKGGCATPTSESCGSLTCSATTGCQKPCTGDTECSTGNYCDLVSGTCWVKGDNGTACTAASQCASGFCVDGLCCSGKCDGACSSCKKLHTNVADGTCASVMGGQDPYDSCQNETATLKCGNTGMCNGAGACQKADKTQTCGTATCNGSMYTPASTCDGLGNCRAGSASDCGSFQCSTSTGCLTSCTGPSDCSSATYCDLSLAKPICTPKLGAGSPCGTDGNKCSSGRCVDGVCCSTDCTGSCYACNLAGNLGTCSPVAKGTKDPKGGCKASAPPCGQDGTCGDNGFCYVPPAGTTGNGCTTTCSGSTLTERSCDGKGTCAATIRSCEGGLACASAAGCSVICTYDVDLYDSNDCVYGP